MAFGAGKCRSCGAPIVWLMTATGKFSPCDIVDGVRPDTKETFNPKIHRSHFATCPNADHHRKKTGGNS